VRGRSLLQFAAIVLLCIAGAVAYAIIHDNITARLCIEYFTVGHRRAFRSDSPTLHALHWGVVATWWVGLGLGIVVACAARLGPREALAPREIVRPLLRTLMWLGAIAGMAASAMYVFTDSGQHQFHLPGPMFDRIPRDKHWAFAVCWASHVTSYYAGGAFALFLAIRRYRSRRSASSPGQDVQTLG
jgi:hypothetical protein